MLRRGNVSLAQTSAQVVSVRVPLKWHLLGGGIVR